MKRFTSISILSLLCAAYACTDANSSSGTSGSGTAETLSGKPVQITTAADRSSALTSSGLDMTSAPLFEDILTLDKDEKFQTIDGFGAAITGAACYNLMKMSAEDRTEFLTRTYSVDKGFGFSYIRISIGCSDFSLSEYTCCDSRGMENFALTDEEYDYISPVLKEIIAINPDVKIMGSPWTCPRWMKVRSLEDRTEYNSWTGGQLNPEFYQDYAEYFVKWIQAFADNGIAIHAVTLQNEPLHRGNSASLYMSWQEQLEFIKTAAGPAFKDAGLDTKIYVYDHNYDYSDDPEQAEYPLNIYADPEASAYIAGAAYHNYGGSSDELLDIHSQAPDKELIFTEASIGEWNDGHNLAKMLPQNMRELGLGTVNKWCRGVLVWNLMLDSEKGPNRPGGCKTCYGAVDIDKSSYKSITYNSHYYMLAHLSSAARSGASRIGNHGFAKPGIACGTFLNPDGSLGAVILNENDSVQNLSLTAGSGQYINCRIPANSVVTLKWSEASGTEVQDI